MRLRIMEVASLVLAVCGATIVQAQDGLAEVTVIGSRGIAQ